MKNKLLNTAFGHPDARRCTGEAALSFNFSTGCPYHNVFTDGSGNDPGAPIKAVDSCDSDGKGFYTGSFLTAAWVSGAYETRRPYEHESRLQ